MLEQGANSGFAGGCRAGVAASSAPLILFLNPDAQPAPGCLAALRAVAGERPGWGAWQALVTMDGGRAINTAGNVAHYLGISWAGSCGLPVGEAPAEPVEVPFASGSAMVVRREAWAAVGGFDERYFMYCEDLDLSLRLALRGYGVGLAPRARVEHDYEFHKGARKWFLLERNRWWTIVSDYPGRLLAPLLPALLVLELALLVVAARDGWLDIEAARAGGGAARAAADPGPPPRGAERAGDRQPRVRRPPVGRARQPLPRAARAGGRAGRAAARSTGARCWRS